MTDDVKQAIEWLGDALEVVEVGPWREKVRALLAHLADLESQLAETQKERYRFLQERDRAIAREARLANEALAALAGAGIGTPEKGYMTEPHCLSADIERLAKERDEVKAHLYDAAVAAGAEYSSAPLGEVVAALKFQRDEATSRMIDQAAARGEAEARVKELLALGEQRCDGIGCDFGEECVRREREERDDIRTAEQRMTWWADHPHACAIHYGARTACGQCLDSVRQERDALKAEVSTALRVRPARVAEGGGK